MDIRLAIAHGWHTKMHASWPDQINAVAAFLQVLNKPIEATKVNQIKTKDVQQPFKGVSKATN